MISSGYVLEVKTNSPLRTKVKMKYMITDTNGNDDKEGLQVVN